MGSNSLQCIQLLLKSEIVINHRNNFDAKALQYYLLNFESHCQDITVLLIAAEEVSNGKLQQYIQSSEVDVPDALKP